MINSLLFVVCFICCLLFVSNIEGEIDKAKKQIAAYKEDLQKARIIRKHRQEYDALAKVCHVETLYLMDTFCVH